MDIEGARKHIIVTDSRGAFLQSYIDKVKNPYAENVKVVHKPGARYEEIVDIAIGQAKRN